jgi:hypothetical protein
MLLDKVLCDVIPCVCSQKNHGSRPMETLEFLTSLNNSLLLVHQLTGLGAAGTLPVVRSIPIGKPFQLTP